MANVTISARAAIENALTVESGRVLCRYGWVHTPAGKEKEVFASVPLPADLTTEETAAVKKGGAVAYKAALGALARQGAVKVNLKLPKLTDRALVTLRQTMPSDWCAAVFATLEGFVIPTTIPADRATEALKSAGLWEEAAPAAPEAPPAKKGKGKAKDEAPATDSVPTV